MADQVQLRGGTAAENDAFTGVAREVTVDTTNNNLRVHDGSKAGGFEQISNAQFAPVAGYATLKALTAGDHDLAYVEGRSSAGDGGEGVFVWRSGDQSVNVANDSQELVWLPPDSDATGASGAWQRANVEALSVAWGGTTADGSTDDSDAFVGAMDFVSGQSGGNVIVPFATDGYLLGDGTTNGTNMGAPSFTRVDGGNAKLIHRAKNSGGQPRLVDIEDAEQVVIENLRVDGGSVVRNGVTLSGTVDQVTIRNCHFYDMENYAIQYADTDTNTASAYFRNVTVRDVRIDGQTGAVGEGSGINFLPRAGDAFSEYAVFENVFIDVSEGSTDQATHGPQGLKLSNAAHVTLRDCTVIGGDIAGVILTTGLRDVHVDNLFVAKANQGLNITSATSSNAPASTVARRITVDGFRYRQEGLSTGDGYGIVIDGDPQHVAIDNFDIEGRLVLKARDASDALNDLRFGTGVIRGSGFNVDDGGVTVTEPIKRMHIEDLRILSPGSNTTMFAGDANWEVHDSRFDYLYFDDYPLQGARVRGDNNTFGEIVSVSGNTTSGATGTPVRDEGNGNSYGLIDITAAPLVEYFLRKAAGGGTLSIGGVKGAPANDQGFDFQNQENSDVPQGDVVVTSQEFDLSGANTTEQLYLADVDTYILGVKFLYPQASSADAGTDQKLRVNKTDILTYTSETDMADFASTNYVNTSGTRSFSTRKIAKGEYLDVSFGGGKTGAGTLIVQVSMVRARA